MPKAKVVRRDAVRFGAIIQRLRLARGWTIARLAQRSGLSTNYLSVLENGGNMPSIATLLELAEVFNTEAAEIVREVEQARRAEQARHAAAVLSAAKPVE